jgi:hypothetical protein
LTPIGAGPIGTRHGCGRPVAPRFWSFIGSPAYNRNRFPEPEIAP